MSGGIPNLAYVNVGQGESVKVDTHGNNTSVLIFGVTNNLLGVSTSSVKNVNAAVVTPPYNTLPILGESDMFRPGLFRAADAKVVETVARVKTMKGKAVINGVDDDFVAFEVHRRSTTSTN